MILKSFKIKGLSLILMVLAIWIISVVAVARLLGVPLQENGAQNGKIIETQRVVDEESVVIEVVETVSPSVVSIAVENRQLFDPFFGLPGEKESGIGTGFVISGDGLILTNKHVVSGSDENYSALIRDNGGEQRRFEIVEIHRDPFNDLAIVKVDANDLKPLELGNSDDLKVGQKVIAIGNALGRFENTVTVGVVSGLGRGVSPIDPSTGIAERLDDLVQTDAAINPGNSGGPLVNTGGQVIGINTAVASAENIGFALKVNIAKQLIEDFKSSGGKISRPLLGVRYTHISRDVALLNEVSEGELVREVVIDSAADEAGIKVGDIITHLDGQKLTEEVTLSGIIRTKKVGDTLSIRIYREDKTLDLTAILKEATE
jgi:serine protease Do